VKFVRRASGQLIFHLSRREHELLVDLLHLYPLLPTRHHRLSRSADPDAIQADQRLLEDSMASRKAAGREQLRELLGDGRLLRRHGSGYQLMLPLDQSEWFLQVLNDVRVGSWVQLGCPDEQAQRPVELTFANARLYLTMELCGAFQYLVLQALDRDDDDSDSVDGAPA
jgi:hypothetical protein